LSTFHRGAADTLNTAATLPQPLAQFQAQEMGQCTVFHIPPEEAHRPAAYEAADTQAIFHIGRPASASHRRNLLYGKFTG
jgi:hypothetical protein